MIWVKVITTQYNKALMWNTNRNTRMKLQKPQRCCVCCSPPQYVGRYIYLLWHCGKTHLPVTHLIRIKISFTGQVYIQIIIIYYFVLFAFCWFFKVIMKLWTLERLGHSNIYMMKSFWIIFNLNCSSTHFLTKTQTFLYAETSTITLIIIYFHT